MNFIFPYIGNVILPFDFHIFQTGSSTNQIWFPMVSTFFFLQLTTLMSYPIGSMYAIYGNIYHQYTPNVSIYTSTMDPMGMSILMAER